MFENDDPFAAFTLAEHLRDCILPYLEMTTLGIPDRVCLTTGEVAWDDCECGQLAVSWMGNFDTEVFPAPWDGTSNAGSRKCGPALFAYQFNISMLRCAPVGGENGAPPPCDAINAATRITAEDAWAVRTGLMCCMCTGTTRDPVTSVKLFERFWAGPQLPAGPDGGCQGSQIDVIIGVKNGGYPCGNS